MTVKARVVNDKELTCIVPSLSFDGALRTAPLTVSKGDLSSDPVAFYYYAAIKRQGRLPIDTFSMEEPADVRIELDPPLGALVRRLVLFIKWKQHALKVRRRARPRRFL